MISILTAFIFSTLSQASELKVGVGVVDITPYKYETRPLKNDPFHKMGDKFFDTGVDGKFDFEETGAFGVDGQPGVAGFDDDHDGKIDNCDRSRCEEYMSEWSDDVKDPHHDNFNILTNIAGTENDKRFEWVHIGGFNPYYPFPFVGNRLQVGIHDPIWARTLSIEAANGVKMLLMSTDLPGLTWKHINPVRRQIAAEFSIPYENIIITSTHNHAGPDAAGYWTTVLPGHNRWYTDALKKWMFQSAAQAHLTMKPAKMKTLTTTHVSCYNSVTRELKKDPHCRIPMIKNEYKKPDANLKWDWQVIQEDKRDPIVRNTDITVLHFDDAQTGAPITTFINWHNHPDTLSSDNMLVSSDFAHYVREYVEKELGGKAVYFTGTLGCQIGAAWYAPRWSEDRKKMYSGDTDINGNPVRAFVPEGAEYKWTKIMSIGYEIGSEVVDAVRASNAYESKPELTVKTEPLDIGPNNFLHELTTRSVWKANVEPEDELLHYAPRCLNRYGCVRNDINLIQFGGLSMITAPGEIDPVYFKGRGESLAEYGGKWGKFYFPAKKGAQEFMKGPHFAVLGEANNYLSYLLPASDNVGPLNLNHPNHYEELVTVNKHFGDDVGNKWMQMLGNDYRYSKRKIYPKHKH